jgi:hypothetical protein
MKFFRKNKKKMHALNLKINQDIFKELKAESLFGKKTTKINKWIQHVRRIDRSRSPHAIMKHQAAGTKIKVAHP